MSTTRLPQLQALCKKIRVWQKQQLEIVNRYQEQMHQPLFRTWQDYQLWVQVRLYKNKQI